MSSLKPVYKGKLINLYTQKKKLPNGRSSFVEVIIHPGAVLIIPFLNRGTVILLKQFRPAINSYIYELPAGTLEEGESLLNCARREIIEETGFAAASFTKLGVIYPLPGYSNEKITIFRADRLNFEQRNVQPDEVIKVLKVSRKEAKSLFDKGKIIDAKTICAFSMCKWL